MNRATRMLTALIATALIGVVSGHATFAAFTRTTANTDNTYAAGTVALGDNDGAGVMWDMADQLPTSAATVRCIRVTFTGSLPSSVRLYTVTAPSGLDPYLDITVEKGSMPVASTFPNCGGFTSQATISSVGTLQAFKSTRGDWANGIPAFPGAQTRWNTGDSLVYRFTIQLRDDFAAQGLTGLVGFTWEAQNQ